MTEECKYRVSCFLHTVSNKGKKFNAFEQEDVSNSSILWGGESIRKEMEFGTHGNVRRLGTNSNSFTTG